VTRAEYQALKVAQDLLTSGSRFLEGRGVLMLNAVLVAAECEFAAEDAWHDRPTNMEDSTHGTH
jgi:hypothetical protein